MKTGLQKSFSLLLAVILLLSCVSCANPRGSYTPVDGAGAGYGKETKTEETEPPAPLPKDYRIEAQSYSTADADAFLGLYRLAERIVDECDSVTFPADLSALTKIAYGTVDYAKAASEKGIPYAFEIAHAKGTALSKRSAFQQSEAGTVTLKLKGLSESDKEWTAHLLFLAMIGQDTAFYCHIATDPIIDDRIGSNNRHVDWEDAIFVCTEYEKYGYTSISEYRIAVDEGTEPDRDDIYTIGLKSTKVSTVTNVGGRADSSK